MTRNDAASHACGAGVDDLILSAPLWTSEWRSWVARQNRELGEVHVWSGTALPSGAGVHTSTATWSHIGTLATGRFGLAYVAGALNAQSFSNCCVVAAVVPPPI